VLVGVRLRRVRDCLVLLLMLLLLVLWLLMLLLVLMLRVVLLVLLVLRVRLRLRLRGRMPLKRRVGLLVARLIPITTVVVLREISRSGVAEVELSRMMLLLPLRL
jgi:hypothetical protein